MNFKLFCIFSLFIYNIILHSLVENSNIKVPDFRWNKTTCTPGYNYWSNDLNDLIYPDVKISPYMESRVCWIFRNGVRFNQPFFPYELLIFLDIFIFSIGFLFCY